MAAPMSSEKMANPDPHRHSDEESDETNPLSPHFNPLKALYSPKVSLPFPQATIFNNLIEYETFMALGGRTRSRDRERADEGGGTTSGSGVRQGQAQAQGLAGPVVRQTTQSQRDSKIQSSRRVRLENINRKKETEFNTSYYPL